MDGLRHEQKCVNEVTVPYCKSNLTLSNLVLRFNNCSINVNLVLTVKEIIVNYPDPNIVSIMDACG